MNEDDLDAEALQEKVKRLKNLVETLTEWTEDKKKIVADHMADIWEEIVPPRNEKKLNGSINYCRDLFSDKSELRNALEEVASLFRKAGVRIENGRERS